MNSKLHAVTDAAGRSLRMFLTADRGYYADWYREAFKDKGIKPCIPSRKSRKVAIPPDDAR